MSTTTTDADVFCRAIAVQKIMRQAHCLMSAIAAQNVTTEEQRATKFAAWLDAAIVADEAAEQLKLVLG